ncbi:heavy metal-binding domain-containing protein [Hymenobacter cellulosilyticus]|uniref:Heavy metal binding domain-containing protein n=1 Tax=Hymenobacter cellulosilyticus TaxID=2932248 RepID=A0A8T9Q4H5_9BACT|nr:heavy metal-binding domain-containing protein [Hymenobacter cellulosilyticus]UOQ70013.1 hypothetical protein MUN79_14570 [Hymenobacter cellulosilyticus]
MNSFLFGVLLAGSALLSSCNQQPTESADTKQPAPAAAGTEAAATPVKAALYECPMGCEGSQSDKPGKCPVCEMDLEKKS